MKRLYIYALCVLLAFGLSSCIKDEMLDTRAEKSSSAPQVSIVPEGDTSDDEPQEDNAASLIMKNATNLTRQGFDIHFFVTESLEDIRLFYRNQLTYMEAEGSTLPECEMPGANTWVWIGEYDNGKMLKIDVRSSGLDEMFEVLIYCEQ